MDPSDHTDESRTQSAIETKLQAEGSTLHGLGPRSLTPSLELVMLLVPVGEKSTAVAPFLHAIENQVEPPFGVMLVYEPGDDAALAVATEFARTRPWLDLVPNSCEPGAAGALRTGFRAIGQGPVIVMSIEGADNSNDIGRMRRLHAEGHPLIIASRDMRGGRRRGTSRLSRWVGRRVNRLLCRAGDLPLHDPTSSFRLYDAALVNELGIESRRGVDVSLELVLKAVARGIEVIEVATTSSLSEGRELAWGLFTRGPRWMRWCRQARRRARPPAHIPALQQRPAAPDPPDVTPPLPADGEQDSRSHADRE
jgi:dolichol-phosphate mannosyltransferase